MQFDWTDDRIALTRKLFHEGASASMIVAELGPGVSRSAVIGKMSRLGLTGNRNAPGRKPAPKPPAPPKIKVEKSAPVAAAAPPPPPKPKPIAAAVVALVPPAAGGISILELQTFHCRWPIDDPGAAIRYCGATKDPTAKAFCEAHARIAYTPRGLREGADRVKPAAAAPLRKAG